MAAQFQFVMRSGPTIDKVFPLEGQEVSIGRESVNTVAINDVEVSRRHARMELRGNAYVIQDLGSTNGTFVNGQRVVGTQVLNPGDTVSLGEGIVLTFESAFDPNATMMSSKASKPVAPSPAATAVAPTPFQQPAAAPVPPVYSGQVPSGPDPVAPAKGKKKFPIWLIIVILALVIICGCIAIFFIIDQFNWWCSVVPFLVPMLGGTCG
jgi:hypothetical protein